MEGKARAWVVRPFSLFRHRQQQEMKRWSRAKFCALFVPCLSFPWKYIPILGRVFLGLEWEQASKQAGSRRAEPARAMMPCIGASTVGPPGCRRAWQATDAISCLWNPVPCRLFVTLEVEWCGDGGVRWREVCPARTCAAGQALLSALWSAMVCVCPALLAAR